MSNRSLIIVGVIVAGLLAASVFFISDFKFFGSGSTGTQDDAQNTSLTDRFYVPLIAPRRQVSDDGLNLSKIIVMTEGGNELRVRDFKNSRNTVTSTNIPGHYFLAGGTDPSGTGAPYSMFYVDIDGSFNITLLKEPLVETRFTAEQDLIQQLGISKERMCVLKYWVGVPVAINPVYAGKNLGFSFCPGATEL